MTKYTINKIFERNFPQPVWKIEVDTINNLLAIESRTPDDTLPYFSIFDFEGNSLLENTPAEAKEWTLENIQGDYLILKRFGEYSPIQSGVQIIHTPSQEIICTHIEYIIKEVYEDYILAQHRLIPSGMDYYIHIPTGEISNKPSSALKFAHRDIHYPVPYNGPLPKFMKHIHFTDQLWLQPYGDIFIWSYHNKDHHKYNLNLTLSTRKEILNSKIMLNHLDKLIPQPYFTVKDRIFILSSNKMNISSYLV